MIDRPFWDFLMNIGIVKWFCNLKICKKIMKIEFFKKLFNCETVTYLFYGIAATVLNWGIYWLLCFVSGIPVNSPLPEHAVLSLIANSIAFTVALIFAFFTNKYIVFKSKGTGIKQSFIEFLYFTVARLFTFFLESVILTISSFFGLNLIIMKIIAGIIVVILNYVFSKMLIFKKEKE